MAEKHKELGTANIKYLLLKLSVPSMLAMFGNAIYNIVDTIFVGRGIGALGIAGVAIVLPVMAIVSSFAHMIGIGTGTLISRQLGRKQLDEVNRTAGNGFLMVIIVGLVFSVIGLLFTEQIMVLFGATPSILPYAVEYSEVVFIGMLWFPFCVSSNNYLRAEGNARQAMTAMLLGFGVNVVLDYFFIFPLGMGMRGAALATIIGKMATFVYLVFYFLQPHHVIKFQWHTLRLNKRIIKPSLSVGLSGFGMRSSSSFANVVLNHTLGALGGDMAIAVFGIVYKITLFFGMPLFGLMQGMQPIIGFNFGADNRERIMRTIKLTFRYAIGYGVIAVVFFMLFAQPIVGLFTLEREIIVEGTRVLRIVIAMMWLMGISHAIMGVHQAMGQSKASFVLAILRWVLLITPLILILPNLFNLGLDGVWLAFPIADFVGAIVALIILYFTLKKKRIFQQ
ncbi:MAG: MATE family efflux transporter [Salinivirgaceae bacterium]|jgi:putative MATE family efflux protein|nr:MATE family efflux transporter [Salinivirgaceae bacterium]